ncbi:hypothetical protein KUC_3575 [Vreelandella boliviensis LC1]|uniref:Uncharacterized protein n=1 Tax=Vreelandella boliviensis LC1 TaxID=1072583 RepID=A0A7U9BXR3_9GAMM|nr:hypothetical protein KUC_3575 [Halomonas boliviensis LC1]
MLQRSKYSNIRLHETPNSLNPLKLLALLENALAHAFDYIISES